jgi:hypothetical protein
MPEDTRDTVSDVCVETLFSFPSEMVKDGRMDG